MNQGPVAPRDLFPLILSLSLFSLSFFVYFVYFVVGVLCLFCALYGEFSSFPFREHFVE
jgi:hypothetical protein